MTLAADQPLAQPCPARSRYAVRSRTTVSTAAAMVGLLVVAAIAAAPFYAGRGALQDLFFILTLLALAQFWNMLAGFAGLVSVGQQAFVGLGGYGVYALAILGGLDPLAALLLAALGAGLVAVPIALVVFRLQGAYFAIGTWVVAEVFRLLLAQVKPLGGGTGTALPKVATTDAPVVRFMAAALHMRPVAARDVLALWLALAVAVATVLLVHAVLRSRQGLALAAIRDNESAAGSVGVEAFRTKLIVYIVAAFGTGLVGALIYLAKARISPDAAFSLPDWTANVIFVVVIGGIGTIEGPIVGVLVFYGLQSGLASFGAWYLMLLGALAIGTMLLCPRGLWGTLAGRWDVSLFPVQRRLVRLNHDHPLSEQTLPLY
jgi:branched-chain amino acid transport system permease protein